MEYQEARQLARQHQTEKANAEAVEYSSREAILINLGSRIDAITPLLAEDTPNYKGYTCEFPPEDDGTVVGLSISARFNYITGSLRPRSATEISATWYANGDVIKVESTEACHYQADEAKVLASLAQSVAVAEEFHAAQQAEAEAANAAHTVPISYLRTTA